MQTLYLIGNGFDINIGLPTSYFEFYKHYLSLNTSNDSIAVQNLKKHLQNCLSHDTDYWSDLEVAMGKYTTQFKTYEELVEVYDNLNDELQTYISDIEGQDLPQINVPLLKQNLASPEKFLVPADQERIMNLYSSLTTYNHSINIINFNYTTSLERILGFNGKEVYLCEATYSKSHKAILKNILHIHGKSDTPILGINDESQIANESLRKNALVKSYLIKPEINRATGLLIDRQAQKIISGSFLICIYGLSLGATDNFWWKIVGRRFLQGCTIIWFVYDKDVSVIPFRKIWAYNESWKQKFYQAAEIPQAKRAELSHNLIIAHNRPIFDIRLHSLT